MSYHEARQSLEETLAQAKTKAAKVRDERKKGKKVSVVDEEQVSPPAQRPAHAQSYVDAVRLHRRRAQLIAQLWGSRELCWNANSASGVGSFAGGGSAVPGGRYW